MRTLKLLALATACLLGSTGAGTPTAPSIEHAYLRFPGVTHQHFVFTATPTTLLVRAPATNTDGNIRELFWNPGSPTGTDEQECATFTDDSPWAQEGIAVRIAKRGKYLDALTLTKNVWAKASWIFNVSWWVTGPSGVTRYARLGYFDESAEVGGKGGHYAPQPWGMCAAVTGTTFSALVWPASDPEPSWTTAQSLTLPARWVYQGKVGLYAGHLLANRQMTYQVAW